MWSPAGIGFSETGWEIQGGVMLASGAGCASSPGEPPTWAGGGSSCGAQLRNSLAQGQGNQSLAQGHKSKNSGHKKISSMKGASGLACLFFWCFCEASAANQ